MRFNVVYSLAVLTAIAGCMQTAKAGTITNYNRVTFQTALQNATLSGQNFDSLPLGAITTVNGVTYTPSMGTALVTNSYLTTTFPNGLGSTSVGFFQNTETLTITFSTPITAFALDINTYASNNGDYRAVVNDGSNAAIASILDVFPNQQTGQFLGFTDSAQFTSIVISNILDPGTGNGLCLANGGCPYTVDTLVYGSSSAIVPEPGTFFVAFLGIAAAGLSRRWTGKHFRAS